MDPFCFRLILRNSRTYRNLWGYCQPAFDRPVKEVAHHKVFSSPFCKSVLIGWVCVSWRTCTSHCHYHLIQFYHKQALRLQPGSKCGLKMELLVSENFEHVRQHSGSHYFCCNLFLTDC